MKFNSYGGNFLFGFKRACSKKEKKEIMWLTNEEKNTLQAKEMSYMQNKHLETNGMAWCLVCRTSAAQWGGGNKR